MPYTLPVLADAGFLDFITTVITNPEKVTFAVIALVLLVILILLIRGQNKLLEATRVNPQLVMLADDANDRVDKLQTKHDREIEVLENLVKDQQTFRLDFVKTMETLPEKIARPIIAAVQDIFTSAARTEFSRIEESLTRRPIRIGVMSIGPTGRVLAINEDTLTMFGWDSVEILGRFIFETDLNIIGPDQQRVSPMNYPPSLAFVSNQRVCNRLVGVYNKSLKEWVWVIVTAEPVVDIGASKPARILTTYIEAGRVTAFDPQSEYAKSLADTAEVVTITQEQLK
jgi:PAS domain-containing protein